MITRIGWPFRPPRLFRSAAHACSAVRARSRPAVPSPVYEPALPMTIGVPVAVLPPEDPLGAPGVPPFTAPGPPGAPGAPPFVDDGAPGPTGPTPCWDVVGPE